MTRLVAIALAVLTAGCSEHSIRPLDTDARVDDPSGHIPSPWDDADQNGMPRMRMGVVWLDVTGREPHVPSIDGLPTLEPCHLTVLGPGGDPWEQGWELGTPGVVHVSIVDERGVVLADFVPSDWDPWRWAALRVVEADDTSLLVYRREYGAVSERIYFGPGSQSEVLRFDLEQGRMERVFWWEDDPDEPTVLTVHRWDGASTTFRVSSRSNALVSVFPSVSPDKLWFVPKREVKQLDEDVAALRLNLEGPLRVEAVTFEQLRFPPDTRVWDRANALVYGVAPTPDGDVITVRRYEEYFRVEGGVVRAGVNANSVPVVDVLDANLLLQGADLHEAALDVGPLHHPVVPDTTWRGELGGLCALTAYNRNIPMGWLQDRDADWTDLVSPGWGADLLYPGLWIQADVLDFRGPTWLLVGQTLNEYGDPFPGAPGQSVVVHHRDRAITLFDRVTLGLQERDALFLGTVVLGLEPRLNE